MHSKTTLHIIGSIAVSIVMMMAVILYGIPAKAASQSAVIKDISDSSDYAMQPIRALAEKGVISGDENGYFHPLAEMTRAEAAKMLVLSLGLDTKTTPETPTFQDVGKDYWAYQYIEKAYSAGIVSGVAPGLFAPDQKCTREQLAKIFINSMTLASGAFSVGDALNSGLTRFKDYDKISNWAKAAVSLAVNEGIIQGSGDTFNPAQYATKEQMATVADRFMTKRADIQDELDAVSNTQVSAVTTGFTFIFSEPIEKLSIQSITDANGHIMKGTLTVSYDTTENYRKSVTMAGEHVKATVFYRPFSTLAADQLITGETYHVRFSFQFKDGAAKTIYCEKDVTLLPYRPYVQAVIPLNANQIRVRFNNQVTVASATDPNNYLLFDENGKAIPVAVIEDAGYKDETNYVILNLSEPIAQREKITVSVKAGVQRFSDLKAILPYSYTVVVSDHTAPDIERMTTTDDGAAYTSVTLFFTEPVKAGTVMIDNVPAGLVSGETTTISGLQLSGAQSHQVTIVNISDGVNTAANSVLTGFARLYDIPGADR